MENLIDHIYKVSVLAFGKKTALLFMTMTVDKIVSWLDLIQTRWISIEYLCVGVKGIHLLIIIERVWFGSLKPVNTYIKKTEVSCKTLWLETEIALPRLRQSQNNAPWCDMTKHFNGDRWLSHLIGMAVKGLWHVGHVGHLTKTSIA